MIVVRDRLAARSSCTAELLPTAAGFVTKTFRVADGGVIKVFCSLCPKLAAEAAAVGDGGVWEVSALVRSLGRVIRCICGRRRLLWLKENADEKKKEGLDLRGRH